MTTIIQMLKNALVLREKNPQLKMVGLVGLKARLKVVKNALQKLSLVSVVGLSNSCNPQPAQRLRMLKNCSVFLYFFQMALQTHQTHPNREVQNEC